MRFLGWLNWEWLRTVSYVAALMVCIWAGRRDLGAAASGRSEVWPRFWFVAAGVLSVLLVGRLSGIGSTAYDLGRREAISGGWYWSARRRLQGAAILGLGAATLVSVVVLARLMGSRMRRYLPPLVCVFGLAGFAATRIVSLHQVDALLYERPIFGARIASLIELTLTAVLGGIAVGSHRSSDRLARAAERNRDQSSVQPCRADELRRNTDR